MVMVTSTGLTMRAVAAMTQHHAKIVNEQGQPITGAIYDRVVDTLVSVLVDAGVPDSAINDLARVITPLRSAIVTIQ